MSTWSESAGSWQPWFWVSGGVIKPGATVTALEPRAGHTDLFVTGLDNTVYSTFWEQAIGWQGWFQIHPETVMAPGSTITAISRNNHIDLFTTRADGHVVSAWWDSTTGWAPWFDVSGRISRPPSARRKEARLEPSGRRRRAARGR